MEGMLRIGPSGNSDSFYASGRKHTYEEAEWLSSIGLNAFEYSFGRGITVSPAGAQKIGAEMIKYDIETSGHAPYYINFANPSEEMIQKSFAYVVKSVETVRLMGGKRVVFHSAAVGKDDRETAFLRTVRNVGRLSEILEKRFEKNDYIVCPETMGKFGQIGRVEEIIALCALSPNFYPCYDFGHINCYMQGAITKDPGEYRRIIDLTFERLGEQKAKNMHIHFSKIEYGKGGEKRHLTFEDEVFGPHYQPLAEIIDEYRMTPFIVCESDGTMADDALLMKKCHKNV